MDKKYVKTNMGNIPLLDYYEIKAQQSGFSSYAEMRMLVSVFRNRKQPIFPIVRKERKAYNRKKEVEKCVI